MFRIDFPAVIKKLDYYLYEDFDGKDLNIVYELETIKEHLDTLIHFYHSKFEKVANALNPENAEYDDCGNRIPLKGVKIDDAIYIAGVISYLSGILDAEDLRTKFYVRVG